MLGCMWMNMGSLTLGMAAWCLGLAALLLRRERGAAVLSVGSFAACACSLCLVVCCLGHLADVGDISAWLDTMNSFRLCAVAVLVGTVALNGAAGACRSSTSELKGRK